MQRGISALTCLAATVVCCASAQAAQRRPNILFIYADDHSPKTVSCYERAYPMARTPNIDALAAAGVRFQGAYLGSWCMPSRASLLTGITRRCSSTPARTTAPM
ncbi:MAG TPA: sulfatase-like hydrolase/transferase [Candidatus Anammoximicrobium sp.]|nr:sulfatase-like hydrolase/transferase [Candidatus Anammoximicrobium sp.]